MPSSNAEWKTKPFDENTATGGGFISSAAPSKLVRFLDGRFSGQRTSRPEDLQIDEGRSRPLRAALIDGLKVYFLIVVRLDRRHEAGTTPPGVKTARARVYTRS